MELYVFNKEFKLLGMIDIYSSLIWTRQYYKSGEFELHVPLNSENIKLLVKENIIAKSDSLEEAAFINHRELGIDEQGEEVLLVRGYFLSKWTNRRITWGKQIQSGRAEEVIKNYVDINCITTDAERIIPSLILSTDKGLIPTTEYSSLYKPLDEELSKISKTTDLGWRILFNPYNSQYIFDVYEGKDRTVNQSINPQSIFCLEYENVLQQSYVDSASNYKNLALVAGQGEDADRKTEAVGESTGLDRFEVFVDARDIGKDSSGSELPESQVKQLLSERGKTKLSEYKTIKTFDSTVNIRGNLKYKRDFDIGDLVTVANKKWGITIDTRITVIQEIYEETGFDVRVSFGNNIPTLIDKIKQELR